MSDTHHFKFPSAKAWRLILLLICGWIASTVYVAHAVPSAPTTQSVDEGKAIFEQKCASCHTIGGGASVGPDVAGVTALRDRDWLIRWIVEPDQMIRDGDPLALELLDEYNNLPMPIPGVTMPAMKIVTRDYKNLYNRLISFSPQARTQGIGTHGVHWEIADMYDDMLHTHPTVQWNGTVYPSLEDVVDAANVILRLAPETNGESAYRAYQAHAQRVGLPLADLVEKSRSVTMTFDDLKQQPRVCSVAHAGQGLLTMDGPIHLSVSILND
ncbi:MAG: hypothetical protein GFH27_549319n124 [Chloroflexi bacterium AL-W]|nr:hypothetical protein [Chloroflexi bacterium AL-N1]NOK71287.1 hypothetical protein [Chloroflexi bacterium AL-N10]NOK77662.1 hypothetical protein [Chloroflexi bacterium AL-N5]NOK84513.1 hypothetical protein [Chloroflexi bacterium AL-W]NOK92964.1 hypothetical protein [Chloroflexi bacterium AL-N15]